MSARFMPALADGRTFTSYLSAGQAEDVLQRRLGVINETQYRQYLQHNSARVANEMRQLHVIGSIPAPPARR